MTDILGTLARSRSHFMPTKPNEYLALQLAKRLSDQTSIRFYLTLFERHSEELVLRAFRKCKERGTLTGADFLQTIKHLTHQEP